MGGLPGGGGGDIVLEGVTKQFGSVAAVDNINLTIAGGEFFSLLGPSGCGKTTTLRMIAGFERPDFGRIVLQGEDVKDLPAHRRKVNMVFQHYALFPHLNVFENIAFGLRRAHQPDAEIRKRVADMLGLVRLQGYEKRRPAQLSGGQQQRVALARALVNYPTALLLDEPLGALDLKLRKQMQLELKHIQTTLRTTFIYVTHDQEEALSMSDRVAVMHQGKVEQVGAPRDIYERPASAFVAGFIGVSNLIKLHVSRVEAGVAEASLGPGDLIQLPAGDCQAGDTIEITVRPEKVQVSTNGMSASAGCRVHGTVRDVVYLGVTTQLQIKLQSGEEITAFLLNREELPEGVRQGAQVLLTWSAEHNFIVGSGRNDSTAGSPAVEEVHNPAPT
jgi:spermidine/putrescine transport system ATP-binding protein